MALPESLSRGHQLARDRPGAFVAGVVAVYLVLDLVAKLLFFEATVGSAKLFGGSLPISQLSTWLWQETTVGLAYGLAAVGLSMVYSILRFPNFAHGELFTAGGFAGWSVAFIIAGLGQFDVGYLALLGAGPVNPTALGINAVVTPLVVLVGLVFAALALRYVINFIYGGSTLGLTANTPKVSFGAIDGQFVAAKQSSAFLLAQNANAPGAEAFYFKLPLLDIGSYTAEIVGITAHEAVLVIVAVLLMYGLHLLLQRTTLGTAMRAMADNKDLARVTGIPTERVIRDT
jgi:branched-chain amino acid transport system permease protein